MKKIEIIIVCITLFNLLVLGLRYFPTKHSPVPKTGGAEMELLKDRIYLNALVDEDRPTLIVPAKSNVPILVLRFSYKNCSSCLQSVFYEAKRMKDIVGDENRIRVLGSFKSDRDFEVFKKYQIEFSFKIENLDEHYFHLNLESSATYPFFFLLFPDGTARHVFIPIKEDVVRTRQYLEIIRQKYFSD